MSESSRAWAELQRRVSESTVRGVSADSDDLLDDADIGEELLKPVNVGRRDGSGQGSGMMPPMMMGGPGGAGAPAGAGALGGARLGAGASDVMSANAAGAVGVATATAVPAGGPVGGVAAGLGSGLGRLGSAGGVGSAGVVSAAGGLSSGAVVGPNAGVLAADGGSGVGIPAGWCPGDPILVGDPRHPGGSLPIHPRDPRYPGLIGAPAAASGGGALVGGSVPSVPHPGVLHPTVPAPVPVVPGSGSGQVFPGGSLGASGSVGGGPGLFGGGGLSAGSVGGPVPSGGGVASSQAGGRGAEGADGIRTSYSPSELRAAADKWASHASEVTAAGQEMFEPTDFGLVLGALPASVELSKAITEWTDGAAREFGSIADELRAIAERYEQRELDNASEGKWS